NSECGNVYGMVALNDLTAIIHQDQVRGSNPPKVHPERIDPEVIEAFWVASRDVSGYTFVESETGEETESRRQPLLAIPALLFRSSECRRLRQMKDIGGSCGHGHPFITFPGIRILVRWEGGLQYG